LIRGGKPVTRRLLDVPNLFIRRVLSDPRLEGLDGELVAAEVSDPECFSKTSSAVRRVHGEPDFTYYVFDRWDLGKLPFEDRKIALEVMELPPYIKVVQQEWVESHDELQAMYEKLLEDGLEGVITKSASGLYKWGRSTLNQNWTCKLKPRVDSEALILQMFEQEENTNVATVNELGHTKRSSAKAGKVGKGTMGRWLVRDIYSLKEFFIGTGPMLTDKARQEFFDDPTTCLGHIIRYSSCPIGVKDLPRQPVAEAFRGPEDL
ncbi:MAG: hypothetical protein WC322_06225, partial [Candidatus Paceibacterota bacterium]